jgi:chemotaxis protein CheX
MTRQLELIEDLAGHSVKEVFRNMVSMELESALPEPFPASADGHILGSVGFVGESNGVIYLYMGMDFARIVTSKMLGIPESDTEELGMVNDAIGELSNMVAGSIKSRLSDGGEGCKLTIPSVVRGQQITVEELTKVTRKVIGFRYGQKQLLLGVLVKEN